MSTAAMSKASAAPNVKPLNPLNPLTTPSARVGPSARFAGAGRKPVTSKVPSAPELTDAVVDGHHLRPRDDALLGRFVDRGLEVVLGNRRKLLPLRRLVTGDTEVRERGNRSRITTGF